MKPVDVVGRLRDGQPLVFLDGACDADGLGRWSLVGADPVGAVMSWADRVLHVDRHGRRRWLRGDPLEQLCSRVATLPGSHQQTDPRPLRAGAMGWFGYELGRTLEDLPLPDDDRSFGMPDMAFWLFDDVLGYDSATDRWHGGSPRGRAIAASGSPLGSPPAPPPVVMGSNFTRSEFEAAVAALKERICSGDVYQVNLAQRFHGNLDEDPYDLYRRLRQASPAPLGAYIEMGRRAVLSNSPELFLALEGRTAETRPIKGTRPRGADPGRDRELELELLASAKDLAELTMIVDLMRNDLGKVAAPGTVRVPSLGRLVRLPTVHHLVATVVATLEPDRGPADLLRATFPAGSISGCPKIRAMQRIAELEPCRRGVYTGAIGWLSATGDLRLNVAIRTLSVSGRRWWFHAGGGIVADSEPAAEYDETLAKAAAFLGALGLPARHSEARQSLAADRGVEA